MELYYTWRASETWIDEGSCCCLDSVRWRQLALAKTRARVKARTRRSSRVANTIPATSGVRIIAPFSATTPVPETFPGFAEEILSNGQIATRMGKEDSAISSGAGSRTSPSSSELWAGLY